MGRFRFLVVLLLLACLPLKVVAAVTMPFCGMSSSATVAHGDHQRHGDPGASEGVQGAPDGQAAFTEHAAHRAAEGHTDAPAPSSDSDCGQCGLCHLACASAIPVDSVAIRIRFEPVMSAAPPASFVSFIPEVLFRPPLRSAMPALA